MLTPYALLSALLAFSTSAHPTRDPIELFYRQTNAGPVAGQIITTCNRPGVLALAFDDGPFTFTQALVDILNQGNAKGTFFFTGTLYGRSCMSFLQVIPRLNADRLYLQSVRRYQECL